MEVRWHGELGRFATQFCITWYTVCCRYNTCVFYSDSTHVCAKKLKRKWLCHWITRSAKRHCFYEKNMLCMNMFSFGVYFFVLMNLGKEYHKLLSNLKLKCDWWQLSTPHQNIRVRVISSIVLKLDSHTLLLWEIIEYVTSRELYTDLCFRPCSACNIFIILDHVMKKLNSYCLQGCLIGIYEAIV